MCDQFKKDKNMAKYASLLLLLSVLFLSCATTPTNEPVPLGWDTTLGRQVFTGDGGRGLTLAVLEPVGRGLAPGEQWILPLVQSSITGDFNRFSAMTIIDRQNIDQILEQQERSLSGLYSDEDFISIGRLTHARYILTGSVIRVGGSYMLELAVSDVETGERRASYPPRAVSPETLLNLSAVREATADLLVQLGVQLTDASLQELRRELPPIQMQAQSALARGINAQRQGTEVIALSYYFQAAALDPSLFEAVNRSSVMTASISSGNIGDDVRSDILWRRDWIDRLTETEQFFHDFFETTILPYTLFYSTAIEQGEIDFQNETVTLNVLTKFRAPKLWATSIAVLQTIYDGLQATGRKEAWGLGDWPLQGVTTLNPFEEQSRSFSIVMEMLNDQNEIIGSQVFNAEGTWTFLNGNRRPLFRSINDGLQIVSISNIRADDITDSLTIRIASVDGLEPLAVAETGVLQIMALTGAEWDFYNLFTVVNGSIRTFRGQGGHLDIPSVIWNESVTSIGNRAFSGRRLSSVTIPNSVTSIGNSAFSGNRLTGVTIPNSVTSIEEWAFFSNQLTNVNIGNNVTYIGAGAFQLNRSLRNVAIPDSVIYVGENAFPRSPFQRFIRDTSWGEVVSVIVVLGAVVGIPIWAASL